MCCPLGIQRGRGELDTRRDVGSRRAGSKLCIASTFNVYGKTRAGTQHPCLLSAAISYFRQRWIYSNSTLHSFSSPIRQTTVCVKWQQSWRPLSCYSWERMVFHSIYQARHGFKETPNYKIILRKKKQRTCPIMIISLSLLLKKFWFVFWYHTWI